MSTLSDNLNSVNQHIRTLEKQHHRNSNDVCLMAVSKTRSSDEIRQLAVCGQEHFGENYLQEALDKMSEITDVPLVWHFIGPIQKNKTKPIAENFSWVHSVDREIIATRLNNQRPDTLPPLNVCIQINIDEEPSKSGILPMGMLELATNIKQLPKLRLRGLMTIPSSQQDFDQQCIAFKKMLSLFQNLKDHDFDVDTLSMGMSNDYEAAIACGATIIRIGTALFGPRDYS